MKNNQVLIGLAVLAAGIFIFMGMRKNGNGASNESTGTGNADTSDATTAVEAAEEEILAQCQVQADEQNLRRQPRLDFMKNCTGTEMTLSF